MKELRDNYLSLLEQYKDNGYTRRREGEGKIEPFQTKSQ